MRFQVLYYVMFTVQQLTNQMHSSLEQLDFQVVSTPCSLKEFFLSTVVQLLFVLCC